MLLGFDIGGTKCSVILGESSGTDNIRIIEKVVIPTTLPAMEMIASLFASAEKLLHKHTAVPSAIGITCGGPLNSATGLILSPPNLPGGDNIPIVDMAEQCFGKKSFLQNDANACAIAEWKFGAGKGFNNIIFLTFGTGMGAGLIIDGRLYSGTTDSAGEAGHIRLSGSGPVGFGKAGSFEGFCSGGGIAQLAQTKASEILNSGGTASFCKSLAEVPFITAKSLATAALNGDPVAIDIYKTSAHYLGKAISILMDILNPEAIIIGGIYVRAHSLLEPTMNEVIAQEALPLTYQHCKILPAALGDNIDDFAALSLAATKNNK